MSESGADASATPPPAPAAKAPGCSPGCLIAIVAPIALIILILAISALTGGGDPSNSYPAEARLHCRDFVKQALKSPSSADFGDESADGSGTTWTVIGHVDSDNSFGASIRNNYRCTVEVSGDSWTLVSLDGLTN